MYLLSGSLVRSPPSKPLASAEIRAGNLTSSYNNVHVHVVIQCYVVFIYLLLAMI